MEEYYKIPFPQNFIRKLRNIVNNEIYDDYEICKKNIQYRTEVHFQIATNTMPVTVISRRLSFFDKLSGFGIIYCLILM